MNRLLSVLASIAIGGGLLTSALVLARAQVPGDPRIGAMKKESDATKRAVARHMKSEGLEAHLKAARRRQIANLTNQLRPIYRAELMSVRTACRLTAEQFRSIRPETDAAYGEAVVKLAEAKENTPPGPLRVSSADIDYETVIKEAVFSVARRHVPAERWAAFQQDLGRREASRRQAGVEFLVATLDRDLQLSGRQREQLAQSLSAHWDNQWYSALEVTLGGNPCVPRIPDERVKPYLSEVQQGTWSRMFKFDGPLWGAALDHGGGPDMDQAIGGIPPARGRGDVKVMRFSRPVPKKPLSVE